MLYEGDSAPHQKRGEPIYTPLSSHSPVQEYVVHDNPFTSRRENRNSIRGQEYGQAGSWPPPPPLQQWGSRKLHPIVKGMIYLTFGPLMLAGSVLYGTGQVLTGVGDVMMAGPLRAKMHKFWKDG